MKKRSLLKRFGTLATAFSVACCSILCMYSYDHNAYADIYTYDEEYEKYLDEQGFPESYKTYLMKLHSEHPNWVFEAMHTGLDWNEVIRNEMKPGRNLIPNKTNYVSEWKDTAMEGSFDYIANDWTLVSSPNWVQASEKAVRYAMDPRNFLNEEYIFMFEQLTFNADAQSLAGVEAMLKGTFMDNKIVEGTGDAIANKYISSEMYAVTETEISGLDPGTTVEEIVSFVRIDDEDYDHIEIIDKNDRVKEKSERVGSGDRVVLVGYVEDVSESGETPSESPELTKEVRSIVSDIVMVGDLNGDGYINNLDRAVLKQYIYGKLTLDDVMLKAADLNHDEKINNLDRAVLKQYIYGDLEFNNIYNSTGLTYAQLFYKVGQELNISPYNVASRVYQEQGRGTSPLISGTYEGMEGYYNYFNMGAFGYSRTEIIVNGLAYAKNKGWDSPYKSICGGINEVAKNYIWRGQDTQYLQKFDVETEHSGVYWHQYMQSLLSARSEAISVRKAYIAVGAIDVPFVFKIPVYLNMPEETSEIPTKDGNPNYKLAGLAVDGYELEFDFNTYEYTIEVPLNVTKLLVFANPVAETSGVAGTGTWTIDETTTQVKVICIAQNGAMKEYHINLIRTEPVTEEETTEEETTAEDVTKEETTEETTEGTTEETTEQQTGETTGENEETTSEKETTTQAQEETSAPAQE